MKERMVFTTLEKNTIGCWETMVHNRVVLGLEPTIPVTEVSIFHVLSETLQLCQSFKRQIMSITYVQSTRGTCNLGEAGFSADAQTAKRHATKSELPYD